MVFLLLTNIQRAVTNKKHVQKIYHRYLVLTFKITSHDLNTIHQRICLSYTNNIVANHKLLNHLQVTQQALTLMRTIININRWCSTHYNLCILYSVTRQLLLQYWLYVRRIFTIAVLCMWITVGIFVLNTLYKKGKFTFSYQYIIDITKI